MTGLKKADAACWAMLALLFVISLWLRMAIPWGQVFSEPWVKLTDNDAYFYARLLDNLNAHFPYLGVHDPYTIFPDGRSLAGYPLFFVYLMGFLSWLAGAGAPTQHTADVVAACLPAVLGALMVFPVFYAGRAAFNRWAGLAAAGFITLMPGEFLVRTLLGNADSHVMEIFLSALFMLFLLLSARPGKGLQWPLRQGDGRRQALRTALFAAAAGCCLGMYVLSWQGAPLFILISFTWLVLQSVSDHLRGRQAWYTGAIGLIYFVTALLLCLPFSPLPFSALSLAAGAAGSAALSVLTVLMRRARLSPYLYPAALALLAGAGLGALFAIFPGMMGQAGANLPFFLAWNPGVQIAEMQPLLMQQGSFTFALLWGNYASAALLALPALFIVIYRAWKQGGPEIMLLAVWSIFSLLAALAMRRFAYYFAVNAALLAGLTCWLILQACGLREGGAAPAAQKAAPKPGKKKSRAGQKQRDSGVTTRLALGVLAVAALVIYPNTGPLPGGDKPFADVATRGLYTPSDAWCESLDWLRARQPAPFTQAGYYYARYGSDLQQATYSTVCWWDYGYWVTRIGQQVPLSNPGSAFMGEQFLYTAPDEKAAGATAAAARMRYVIVNDYLVKWDGGFKVMAQAAGEQAARYYEIYYRSQNGKLTPTLLYYPEFYRTMAARLYCFGGAAYTPSETAAVSWEFSNGADGTAYREITGLKTFRSYGDAEAFMALQKDGNWRIVGKDPAVSPVPLEALKQYRPAFASRAASGAAIPEVRIFEYTPAGAAEKQQ